jgi:hypothetical protein
MRGAAESLNVCLLLQIFVSKKADDLRWIVEFEADSENRLTRVFWMSPEDVALARAYTDVVLQDSTYKTNRFGMALSLFTIIDCNGCL